MKKMLLLFQCVITVAYSEAQAVNNEPCTAIAIPVENTACEPSVIYSYTGATATAGVYSCYSANPNPLDVWYKVVVPPSGKFLFRMAAAPGNPGTIIGNWYLPGSCSGTMIPFQSTNGTNIGCNYSLPYAGIATNIAPGSTVYLRVYDLYNASNGAGSFKFCVSNIDQLADDPCNAGFIDAAPADPLGQNCVPTKSYSYTNATLTPAIPNPSCLGSGYAGIRDAWFKVRVPASGKLNITLGAESQYSAIVAYTASSCNGVFTELGCVYNNNGAAGINLDNLTADNIVYVRVYNGYGTPMPSNTVKLCAADRVIIPAATVAGNIGIGIDNPYSKIDVNGAGIIREKLTVGADLETRGDLIVKGKIISKMATGSAFDSIALPNVLGGKLSLWGGFAGNHYGLGIQSGTLQMFSDAPGSNIAFGYGNSYGLTERARIINQGEFGMTLTGRMQLKTGTQSAGMWFTNMANSANVAFTGMASDNQVGFHGTGGAGWGLTMNTVNANVGIGLNGAQPLRPLSFPASLGEKILLYPGGTGEVGIGVYGNELRLHADNPGAKISFGTQTNAGVFTENALAQRNGAFAFSILGQLWVNGTTYASDERFKTNITGIEAPLEKLMQLRGVEYEMKTEEFGKLHFTGGRQMGLLAQNVERIVPEAVQEKDGYKGVDYARLVPLLIESIKELKQEINELKNRINHQQ